MDIPITNLIIPENEAIRKRLVFFRLPIPIVTIKWTLMRYHSQEVRNEMPQHDNTMTLHGNYSPQHVNYIPKYILSFSSPFLGPLRSLLH